MINNLLLFYQLSVTYRFLLKMLRFFLPQNHPVLLTENYFEKNAKLEVKAHRAGTTRNERAVRSVSSPQKSEIHSSGVIHNNIQCAMENQGVNLLVLLDLSSAFDTIDHPALLSRLQHLLVINGTILAWFESYLSDRTQCVHINGKSSAPQPLQYGVPQGQSSDP